MSVSSTLLGALLAAMLSGVIWCVAANLCRGDQALSHPRCSNCDAKLPASSWLTFVVQRKGASCPDCGAIDPWRQRFELLWIVYVIVAALRIGEWGEYVQLVLFAALLSVILIVDLRANLTYFGTLFAGFLLGSAFAISEGADALSTAMAGAATGVAIAIIFRLLGQFLFRSVRSNPVQMSDIYLAGTIGVMAGLDDLLQGVLFALVMGAIVVFMQWRGALVRRLLPFGPLLTVGVLLAFIY